MFKAFWSEWQLLFFHSKLNWSFYSLSVYFLVIFILKNLKNFTEVWMYKVRLENHVSNAWWKNTLWPLLSQGYIATTRRKFTFYYSVPGSSRCSTDQLRKHERLSWSYSHPVNLNRGPLYWESSTLTTRSLLHELRLIKKLRTFKNLNVYLIKWNFDSFLLWELQKSACSCISNIFISSGKIKTF